MRCICGGVSGAHGTSPEDDSCIASKTDLTVYVWHGAEVHYLMGEDCNWGERCGEG